MLSCGTDGWKFKLPSINSGVLDCGFQLDFHRYSLFLRASNYCRGPDTYRTLNLFSKSDSTRDPARSIFDTR
jgi:hypothetical protein